MAIKTSSAVDGIANLIAALAPILRPDFGPWVLEAVLLDVTAVAVVAFIFATSMVGVPMSIRHLSKSRNDDEKRLPAKRSLSLRLDMQRRLSIRGQL